MPKRFFHALMHPVRRALGVATVIQRQDANRHQIERLRFELSRVRLLAEKAASLLEYSVVDEERVRCSLIYSRCRELVSLLEPQDLSGAEYVRVGRDMDGGYVMIEEALRGGKTAYSFGIADDASWDLAMAERGFDVYMYDPSISAPPFAHPQFRFEPAGVSGKDESPMMRSLQSWVAENGHSGEEGLVLKMDVEGCEWDVLDYAPTEVVAQFVQIALEYHSLSPAVDDELYTKITRVLAKLNRTHQCVHVHGNSASGVSWIGGMVLPSLMEATYVRRRDFEGRFSPNSRSFPTDVDRPTFRQAADIALGRFAPPPMGRCRVDEAGTEPVRGGDH